MTLKVWIKSALLAGVVASGLAFSLAIPPAAAQSDQWNALYDRIIRLEAEVRARNGAPGQPADAGQLNAIMAQLRQLSFQVEQMQRRQDDLDARLAAIEQGGQKQGQLQPRSDQQYARQQVIIPDQQNQTVVQQPGVDLSQYQNQQLSQLANQPPVYQNQGSVQQAQGPKVLGQISR